MKLIRRYYIFVRLDTDPRFSSSLVEESFNGCDELYIDVFQAMYGSCDFTVLKLFEGECLEVHSSKAAWRRSSALYKFYVPLVATPKHVSNVARTHWWTNNAQRESARIRRFPTILIAEKNNR